MAFANCSSLAHVETSSKHSIITSSCSISPRLSLSTSSSFSSSSINRESRKLSIPPNLLKIDRTAAVRPQAAAVNAVAEAFTEFKHLLLPITDRNPYLSEGTRQAAATTAALAKKYGADITVVVIDEKLKESLPEHDTQLSSIRWHLSEGGFQEFKLLERLGEGSKPTSSPSSTHLQQFSLILQNLQLKHQTMPRIFIFYNLIYSIFLSLLPKTLRHFLPKSPTQNEQDGKSDACVMEAFNVFAQNDTVSSPPPPQPLCSSRLTHHHLHRIFQLFDKNNDGNVTKQELNESLQAMNIFVPELDLVHMINKVDANNDGCVDLDEFGNLYNLIMDEQDDDQDGKSDACVMEAFNVFDQNRDGFIAVDELGSVLESLGLKPAGKSDDCRRMIMKVDVDGDGRVSFSEFKEMMRSGGLGCLAEN